jgi:hypothetical protein
VEIVISSVPLIALVPDQAPEALQLVALVEYQVNEITESNETDADELERVVVGLGSGVGVLPPTPPPPHAEMKSKIPSEYTNSLKFLKKIVLLLSTSLILA